MYLFDGHHAEDSDKGPELLLVQFAVIVRVEQREHDCNKRGQAMNKFNESMKGLASEARW